jgi:galactokinase
MLTPQSAVIEVFKRQFGFRPPHVIDAPGRVELLGNHTDYNQGLALAAAVDRHISFACAPRADGRIRLVSEAFPGSVEFSVSALDSDPAAPWVNYVKGLLQQLKRLDIPFRGFDAAVASTVPAGAGLSSSGALLVAAALGLRALFPFRLEHGKPCRPPMPDARGQLPALTKADQIELARLCQAAENGAVGLRCGLLDPLSSLAARAHHALEIDFRFDTWTHVPFTAEVAFVVCPSGVRRELVHGPYNELQALCAAAAAKFRASSLRSLEPADLQAARHRLSPREFECATHVLAEIRRVMAAERALRAGDLGQFGNYMFQSHASSRDLLRNSCAELDLLVELARRHPACLGARLTGGGFGGAMVSLVEGPAAGAFMGALAQGYRDATGLTVSPLSCRLADGARARGAPDPLRARKRRERGT